MPKVSVIIPCYNVAKYIGQCLESLLNQTLVDIEIICIDDKSTDNTLAEIKKYARQDNRIVVKALKQNSGVAMARNTGIKMATGEFISFIDSDDFLPDTDVLMDMYNAAKTNNAKICGGSIIMFNPTTGGDETTVSLATKFPSDGWMNYSDWLYDYGFTRFIYNRKWIIKNKIYFPNYIRHEDPVFFINAMCCAERFYALSRPTYTYRVGYKKINCTYNMVCDTFNGILDCLNICRKYNMWPMYMRVAEHIQNMLGGIKQTDTRITSQSICGVLGRLANDVPNEYVPPKLLLGIARRYCHDIYRFYTAHRISIRRMYFMFMIPFLSIIRTRACRYIRLFGFVPLVKIQATNHAKYYYLFNIIPVLKIKG